MDGGTHGVGGRWTPAGQCALLALDVVAFGALERSDNARQRIRRALYEVLLDSLARCAVSGDDVYWEDRGDGVLVAVSAQVRTSVLLAPFVDWMYSGLRRHNEVSSDVARIRLRVAVHTGEVDTDEHGLVGTAVNHVFRLVDAGVLKSALAGSAATLAVIASDRVYDDVIRHGPDLVDPTAYNAVEVHTKETAAGAWIRLLGVGAEETGAPRPVVPGVVGRSITSFVGRENEVAALRECAQRCRLVTVVGTGGVGKTRLALEAVRSLVEDGSAACADGAYIIDLAGYRPRDDLCLALLAKLHLATRSSYGPPDREPADAALVTVLADRRVILVLDNCEHLLDEVAAVADVLLTNTDGTSLVATSREALGVASETTVVLGPLQVPLDYLADADPGKAGLYPAMRLFADRARSAMPDFRLTADNVADIARVCRALDGLPLPIELAAAKVRALTPRQIADKLADRFRLLTGGSRTVPRHRTLQAVVDWSYDLLDEATKQTFAFLSIFQGGFSLSQAENLAVRLGLDPVETQDNVLLLVNKSMLQAKPSADGAMRYRMLETLREYCGARLAEAGRMADVRRQHAELYVQLAEQQAGLLRSGEQGPAIRLLEREDDNLRAAFAWCCRAGEHDLALRQVDALGWYLGMWGDRGIGWAGVVRALDTEPTRQDPLRRARALIWSCYLGSIGNSPVEPVARAHGQEAGTILERLDMTDTAEYALCLVANAFASYRDNDHDEGNALVSRALDLTAKLADPWLAAGASIVTGIGHVLRGEFAHAEDRLQTSVEHYRTAGDTWGEHRAHIWLSRTYECTGRLRDAEDAAALAVAIVRSLDLGGAAAPMHGWIARLRALRGDRAGAAAALEAVEQSRWWRRTVAATGWIAETQALLLEESVDRRRDPETGETGTLRRAAELYGMAASELAVAGFPVHAVHSRCREAIMHARLGESVAATLDSATRSAQTMTDPRGRALVLDTTCLVCTDRQRAAHLLADADAAWRRIGVTRPARFASDIERLRTALR
jgi:predicted ATPase